MKGWTQIFIPLEVNVLSLKAEGVNIDTENIGGVCASSLEGLALTTCIHLFSLLSSVLTSSSGSLFSVLQQRCFWVLGSVPCNEWFCLK